MKKRFSAVLFIYFYLLFPFFLPFVVIPLPTAEIHLLLLTFYSIFYFFNSNFENFIQTAKIILQIEKGFKKIILNKFKNNLNLGMKLSEKLKEAFKNKDTSTYKNPLVSSLTDQLKNFSTTSYKRNILLSKIGREEIPKADVLKRAIEKENENLPKEENREKFLLQMFSSIDATLSPEALSQVDDPKDKFKEYENRINYYDNNIIIDLCHNVTNLKNISDANFIYIFFLY